MPQHKCFFRIERFRSTFRGKTWMRFNCDNKSCSAYYLVEVGYFQQRK